MTKRFLIAVFCLFVSLVCLSSQAWAEGMRIGDNFDLRIGGVPPEDAATISGNYTVDGEGSVNLPFLGKLHVVGMNSSQIQTNIERAYVDRGYFTHPTIALNTQATAKFVNVSGAVKNPSRIPYTPDMTLMSAINAANDFNDYADQKHVRLTQGGKVLVENCKEIRKNPALDVKIQPGDSIMVPEGFF